jgi:hypothetical protein
VQVLLARELEADSGGYATLKHDEIMEELRHTPGWEITSDPRLLSARYGEKWECSGEEQERPEFSEQWGIPEIS